jgi:hypothetical protein
MTTYLGLGSPEDEKIFRFVNNLTRAQWINKTENWFTKSYNKPGGDDKESFASSSKGMIVGNGTALLGKRSLRSNQTSSCGA